MKHNINDITVIGAGAMGAQIGMVAALAGLSTTVVDINQEALDAAKDQLWSRVDRDVEKERRDADDVHREKGRLQFSTDQDEAVATTDFVIEAAVENLAVKRDIFAQLDQSAPAHAILTTNSLGLLTFGTLTAQRKAHYDTPWGRLN